MNTTISESQLLDRLNWRYATKQFDPKRKLSPETLATLESALVLSASSGGLQPWKFVVVSDPVMKEKLLPASYGQPQVSDSSQLVVFTARKNFSEADVDTYLQSISQIRGVPLESLAAFRGMLVGGIVKAKDPVTRDAWAARQTYIALGTLLTSAALLGVDACPMEGFNPAQYDEILGLTERGLTATVICALGYRVETDGYAKLPKVRFSKEKLIIHV